MVKGIILAGGTGSRLFPLTKVTNKHLLPVYNKPMIYYPLNTLTSAGIKEILIVSGVEHAGDFLRLLGSGKDFGVKFTYEIQENASGIADALRLAEGFAKDEKIVVILGDNIFEESIKKQVQEFEKDKTQNARIFLKEVPDAHRFGVAQLAGKKVTGIEEKPAKPKSSYAVTGLYFYPNNVFEIIRTLKPSKRGEFEISDVNNHFIRLGKMNAEILNGFWSDAGTFESLYRASGFVKENKF